MDRRATQEALVGLVRLMAGLAALVALVSVLGVAFRPELSRFAKGFVARFGLGGMLVGSVLADGLHFPVPPQFYLFTGIVSGYSRALVFVVVLAGSELGGYLAFELARFAAARSAFVRARIEGPRRTLARLTNGRRDGLGIAAATLFPLGYSTLCMAGGAMGLPRRAYIVFALARVVRLALSYVVIVVAWTSL